MNRTDLDHRLARIREPLVVPAVPPVSAQPGCGPTTHRAAFSDSASRSLCRLGPTAHRVVPRWRRMLFAALGLPCFRAPPAEGVGEPMLEAPRNNRQIAGRNT